MRASFSSLPIAGLALAWLLPNHYQPWISAWLDGLALALLALAALLTQASGRLTLGWLCFFGLVAVSVTVQCATGHLFFAGDGLMVFIYLTAFVLAITVGSGSDSGARAGQVTGLELLCFGLVIGAMAATAQAVYQWIGAKFLGIWVVDLPPGGRPFANVAQPNHLCSIAFLGLVSASFLRQRLRLASTLYWPLATCLLAGMVISASRTGWLQIGLLVLAVLTVNRKLRLEPGTGGALAIGLMFVAMTASWPIVSDWVQPITSRMAAQMLESGTRPLHWASMLDAIGQQPLWGYGWQQVSVAQVRVADRQPFVGEHIEHSHNIVLDLLVWAGVPVGGILALLALGWFFSRARSIWREDKLWLWIGATGLFIHGLLEYPLEYAYFLVPLGLFIGAVDGSLPGLRHLAVGVWVQRLAGALLAATLMLAGAEYLEAENAHRTLRMETARIGSPGIQTPAPELKLLTQQTAFLRFAQTEAKSGMSDSEIEWMRKVSERFAYPPAMFRYALAAGLNRQPENAALTLKRLCLMHPAARCTEGIESWRTAQDKFPVLRAVPAPVAGH